MPSVFLICPLAISLNLAVVQVVEPKQRPHLILVNANVSQVKQPKKIRISSYLVNSTNYIN